MWFTYMHTSLTITCKNSHVLWMPVCNWSSAHLYTIMLCRSFNNFTGCLSTNVSSLKSFWSPLKYSRAQLLKISAIKFLFNCHPVMIYGEITRDFFWAPQSVSRKLPQGNWSFMAAAPQRHSFEKLKSLPMKIQYFRKIILNFICLWIPMTHNIHKNMVTLQSNTKNI